MILYEVFNSSSHWKFIPELKVDSLLNVGLFFRGFGKIPAPIHEASFTYKRRFYDVQRLFSFFTSLRLNFDRSFGFLIRASQKNRRFLHIGVHNIFVFESQISNSLRKL